MRLMKRFFYPSPRVYIDLFPIMSEEFIKNNPGCSAFNASTTEDRKKAYCNSFSFENYMTPTPWGLEFGLFWVGVFAEILEWLQPTRGWIFRFFSLLISRVLQPAGGWSFGRLQPGFWSFLVSGCTKLEYSNPHRKGQWTPLTYCVSCVFSYVFPL